MKTLRWLVVSAALVFSGGYARPAFADDDLAAALFVRAERAFTHQQYEKAARLFEDADAKAPHPSVLYNAAVSWDYAGRPARAADAYRRALQREGLTEEQADDAEKRLEILSTELGFVDVAKPIGALASVAHVVRAPIPARFYLDPGSYDVLVQDPSGAQITERIVVTRGQTLRVEIDPVHDHPPPPLTAAPPIAPPQEVDDHTQEIFGWVTLGLGVLAAGTAVYCGVRALDERDTFYASGLTDSGARDSSAQYRLGSNVAWAGSGVFGAVGLALVLTSPTIHF